ncbi:hypothetical protein BDZ94DRAFT_1177531 [Collybia nuda]|uniref:ATP-grasp domain-containing protein n=1 Tax=Collybia nuda TaxID=64659 RepID=A0A9P6CBY3_9AGAR|nr:hypothetical protein BDZ94DRAFT_1177531 [Collybia nuda]
MTVEDSLPIPHLKIAFTFDRKAEWLARGLSEEQCLEFESDTTIEGIASGLRKYGSVEMVGGLKALAARLTAGSEVDWDLVFNICEGYGVPGREAQVPALLEAWGLPFTFSDSATLALCIDKAKTKMVLEHYAIPTAPFACVPPRNTTSHLLEINAALTIANSPHCESLQNFPLFVKPCAISSGIGITQANKVMNSESLQTVVNDLSIQYPSQPILIERFLDGREFTVGLVGTGSEARVLGVRELVYLKHNPDQPIDPSVPYDAHDPALLQLDIYGRELKRSWSPNPQFKDMALDSDPVVKAVADVALKAWRILGCRDGGRIDIRHDILGVDAIPNVIEVNPIAGLRPNWSDLPQLAKAHGVNYEGLLGLIISSAMQRAHLKFI